MKFPKHRANCFIVMRYMTGHRAVVMGVFPTDTGADEFAGACTQEFIEKGFTSTEFHFEVQMTTYYDA
jgi:hypothetical protein